MQDHLKNFIYLLENSTNSANLASFYFGGIKIRFFATKYYNCTDSFSVNSEAMSMIMKIQKLPMIRCHYKSHINDMINKDIKIGNYSYSNNNNIVRVINTAMGKYDNTGINVDISIKK